VMLKDISDSKRINDHWFEVKGDSFTRKDTATIISGLFWPKLNNEQFVIPKSLQGYWEAYSKEYSTFKTRELHWKPSMGEVELTVELGGKTFDLNVSPLQASIIVLFGERHVWKLADLEETLKLEGETIKRRMGFWINRGILKKMENEDETYSIVEDSENTQQGEAFEDEPNRIESKQDSVLKELQGIIRQTSLMICRTQGKNPITCEQMHSKLSIFVPNYASSFKDAKILREILTGLVKDGLLEESNDSFCWP